MTHCAKQYRVVRKLVSYVIGGDVQLCSIGTVVSGIQIGWYTSDGVRAMNYKSAVLSSIEASLATLYASVVAT